ncbi:MAG: glutamine--fructose-6-phosphate transaminase (isomerizing) [Gammaproteobacteria bacterium]|nr:glutamine--fructose-6-phosphate transaminase (isomerizing) [Gammaproteobacteria bacterium]MYD76091.1 glutamine--fructose-6-phosphate transaminase (isomerizing) [Gammaproteobacteria bacterium]
MCGIIGAISKADVLPILLDGLKRLEYRGYDSSGLAIIQEKGSLSRLRAPGKLIELERTIDASEGIHGRTGIAHTRWATHGPPTENNAHPHVSGERIALVCNGIVENHEELRNWLVDEGMDFHSETDTEVIVNLIRLHMDRGSDFMSAVRESIGALKGAYALGIVNADEPGRIIGARRGSPLIVGVGKDETYLASDISALIAHTRDFIVLENGDIVDIDQNRVTITDLDGRPQDRDMRTSTLSPRSTELGNHRHYMEKEIHEQGQAASDTLEGRITARRVLEACFGTEAKRIFDKTRAIQILACGTSYHAGLVARYWLEDLGIPCQVEIASEFLSRKHAVPRDCLVVALSQSGETIDTLSSVAYAKECGYAHSLAICNAPDSSLVRDSELVLMTHAGPEIGVASTKAFVTQLVALRLFAIVMGRRAGLDMAEESKLVRELRELPARIESALELESAIQAIAEQFANKQHALFLGRGIHYPIALEGALKLKEISYVHAEAYPAGELKHGPLALVDSEMPVVSVAPNDMQLGKLKGNIEEVRARGGKLIVFADSDTRLSSRENLQVINVASVESSIAPIIFTIPLQLLAYHVALIKGTDIDKPRNLAKSVTVE